MALSDEPRLKSGGLSLAKPMMRNNNPKNASIAGVGDRITG